MQLTEALRWAIYDRVIAFGSFLLGALVTVGVVYAGAGDATTTFLFEDPTATPGTGDLAIVGVGVLVGLFVWQVGRATARHRSMVTATERRVDEQLDHDDVARAAVSKIDERMGAIESDLEEVRRQAARVEQTMRSDEFGVEELEQGAGGGSASGGSVGTSATAGTGAATGGGDGDDAADLASDGPTGGATTGTADGSPAAPADAAATDDQADSDGEASGDPGAGTESSAAADAAEGDDDATAADGTEDGFEWGDDDEEYYRNS